MILFALTSLVAAHPTLQLSWTVPLNGFAKLLTCEAGVFASLGEKTDAYDLRDGTSRGGFDTDDISYSNGKILLFFSNRVDVLSGKSLKRELTVDGSAIRPTGAYLDGHVYFLDVRGLVDATAAGVKQLRKYKSQWELNASPIIASRNRVFANLDKDWLLGLDRDEFKKGWKCYANCDPAKADDQGIYTRSFYPSLSFRIGYDGRMQSLLSWNGDLSRAAPAVGRNLVLLGGRTFSSPRNKHPLQVQSAYLFAFDKRTLKVRWKVPMAPSSWGFVGSYVADIAVHHYPSWTPIDSSVPLKGAAIELRSQLDGRLLFRQAAAVRGLQCVGDQVFVRDDSRLYCYLLR